MRSTGTVPAVVEQQTKRKRRSHAREELLTATLTVIVERGLAATQINDVAATVGISPAGLLYHFGSRQVLLLEALRYKDQRWIDEIDAGSLGEGSARIDALVKLLLDPTPKQKAAWRRDWMVWWEAVVAALHDDQVRTSIKAQDARWTAVIADVLCDAHGQAHLAAAALSSLVDGLAIRLLVFPGELTHKKAAAIARAYAHQLTDQYCATAVPTS